MKFKVTHRNSGSSSPITIPPAQSEQISPVDSKKQPSGRNRKHPAKRPIQQAVETLESRQLFSAVVYYVDAAATGSNSGASWANAYTSLASALTQASNTPGEIRLAGGTYKPNGSSRSNTFSIPSNTTIRGGYAGVLGSNPDARDIAQHLTVLSGDIGVVSDSTDNVYHVVTISSASGVGLDGLTISGGYADGNSMPDNSGGGLLIDSSSPTLQNLTFSDNFALHYGGGAFVTGTGAAPTFENSTWSSNTGNWGGGIAIYSTTVSITTLDTFSFDNNTATNQGGGIYISDGSANITNGSLTSNTATSFGGGMMTTSTGTTTISGATFKSNRTLNTSGGGGGGAVFNATTTIYSSLFDRNTSAFYGGGVYRDGTASGTLTLGSVAFFGNSAGSGGYGGGAFLTGLSETLAYCTFVYNTSDGQQGHSIYSQNSLSLAASVFLPSAANPAFSTEFTADTGSITVDRSLAPFALTGTGNLLGTPSFVRLISVGSSDVPDLTPTGASPAFNAGSASDIPAGNTTDAAGRQRTLGSNPDLGAYELSDFSAPTASLATVVAPTAGATSLDLQVTYTDNVGIDLTSLGTGDILVSGPNGYSANAQFISVNGNVATYRLSPPSGTTFASALNGTYTVSLVAGSVADTAQNTVAGATLGTYVLDLDKTIPTATINEDTLGPLVFGAAYEDFVVTYDDNIAIDTSTIGTGDIFVSGPGGSSTAVQFVSLNGNAATYRIIPRFGNAFSLADDGAYTFSLVGGSVADTSGNTVAAITLGAFFLFVSGDHTPPTASLQPVVPPDLEATVLNLYVIYSDDIEINSSTIGMGDLLVSGPGGWLDTPTFVSFSNGMATYQINSPTDSYFSQTDNGTYTVSLVANSVTDTAGNGIAAATLGTFDINISAANDDTPILAIDEGNPTAKADLTVKSVTVKKANLDLVGGSTITGSVAIKNTGKAAMKGIFTVTIYLSTDEEASTLDTQVFTTPVGPLTLSKGEGRHVKYSFTMPAGISGSYRLIAVVDYDGSNAEKTTLNNATPSGVLSVSSKPNLAVKSKSFHSIAVSLKTSSFSISIGNTSNLEFSGKVVGRLIDNATGFVFGDAEADLVVKANGKTNGKFFASTSLIEAVRAATSTKGGVRSDVTFKLDPDQVLGESDYGDNEQTRLTLLVSSGR